MNPLRSCLAAGMPALFTLALIGTSPGLASAAATSNSPQAINAYKTGLRHVLTVFLPANGNIIDADYALTTSNWRKTRSDAAIAVARILRAKRSLDQLAVPPQAVRIQSLMEKAFTKFLSGAKLVRRGASKHILTTIENGTSVYQSGSTPLQQATILLKTLK